MKAIVIKPGKYARIEDIDPTYSTLRSLVGGNIEMTYPFEDEYLAVVEGYMEYYGYTDMTSFVNDYGVENVEKQGHADALLEKVMKFCYDNAVKTEAPLETEAEETTAPAVG